MDRDGDRDGNDIMSSMLRKTKKGFYVLEKLSRIHGLVHGFSTVEFGNMSFVHGKKSKVLENRVRFAQAVGIDPKRLVSVNQKHGKDILIVNSGALINQSEKIIADGLMTNKKNIVLLIKTADCLPILFFDPKKEIIGLVHAGRKGVSFGVHIKAIIKMKEDFGCYPKEILIGIGPAICDCCYDGIDLAGSVVSDFLKKGIKKENIEESNICTFENRDFYSHRRSKFKSEPEGRLAAIFSLK